MLPFPTRDSVGRRSDRLASMYSTLSEDLHGKYAEALANGEDVVIISVGTWTQCASLCPGPCLRLRSARGDRPPPSHLFPATYSPSHLLTQGGLACW